MTMNSRILGGTGLEVSTYCLGTMMFGADGNPGHDDCVRIIHAALDQGINFVDTADMYGGPGGETEEIVGRALQGRRDDIVLATKVRFPMGEGPGRSGNSRRDSLLARGVEAAVLPACQRLGMGVLTWSPLAWGFLSGRLRPGAGTGPGPAGTPGQRSTTRSPPKSATISSRPPSAST